MNGLDSTIRTLGDDRRGCGTPWAIVGGLAVSVLTEPRFTRDINAAVAVGSDVEAEAVARSLVAIG